MIYNTSRDVIILNNGGISVRLYFTWLTGALIFRLFDMAQYVYGSIFDYNVYARVTTMMLVLAFVAYGRTRDPMVTLIAMLFICQVVNREDPSEGDADAKETFEKLLEVAKVMIPVFPVIMTIDFALDVIVAARAGAQSAHVTYFRIRIEEEDTSYGIAFAKKPFVQMKFSHSSLAPTLALP